MQLYFFTFSLTGRQWRLPPHRDSSCSGRYPWILFGLVSSSNSSCTSIEVNSINWILILNTYGTPTPTPQYNVFWGVPKKILIVLPAPGFAQLLHTECVLPSREQPADLFSVAIVQNPVVKPHLYNFQIYQAIPNWAWQQSLSRLEKRSVPMARWQSMLLVITKCIIMVGDDDDDGDISVDDDGSSFHCWPGGGRWVHSERDVVRQRRSWGLRCLGAPRQPR